MLAALLCRMLWTVDVYPFVNIHVNHRMVAGALHYVYAEGGISYMML